MAQWALPAIKKDYFGSNYTSTAHTSLDWYWDPDGKLGQNDTWPLFDGTYSNTTAQTAGLDGLPVGDLNWFAAKKTIWQNNKTAIDTHILALNLEKMNLTAINNVSADRVKLIDNYPNPCKETVNFRISENQTTETRIAIFNTLGQIVEVLNIGRGITEFAWNVTKMKSGTYYYETTINGIKQNGVLLKK